MGRTQAKAKLPEQRGQSHTDLWTLMGRRLEPPSCLSEVQRRAKSSETQHCETRVSRAGEKPMRQGPTIRTFLDQGKNLESEDCEKPGRGRSREST